MLNLFKTPSSNALPLNLKTKRDMNKKVNIRSKYPLLKLRGYYFANFISSIKTYLPIEEAQCNTSVATETQTSISNVGDQPSTVFISLDS